MVLIEQIFQFVSSYEFLKFVTHSLVAAVAALAWGFVIIVLIALSKAFLSNGEDD